MLAKKLLKSAAQSALVTMLGMAFTFFVGIQLARGLGVEEYGIYSVAMSVIALVAVPTEFGLPQLVTREVAAAQITNDWGRMRGVIMWSTRIVIVTTICIASVVFIGLAAIGDSAKFVNMSMLVAGLFIVLFVALGKLQSASLMGLQHLVIGQFPDTLLRPAMFSVFLLLVSLTSFSLNASMALWLAVASTAITFIVATVTLRRHAPAGLGGTVPRICSRVWWSTAIPMALTEGMRVTQGHLVTLLMGLITTVSAVGLYKVASSVALMVAVPASLLHVISAPVLARLHTEGDYRKMQRLITIVAVGITVSCALLSAPFAIAGQPILAAGFGDDFGAANDALLVLCISAVISGFFGVNSVLLNMTGHHARVTRASSLSLVVLVVTAPLLIMTSGVIGAALANALSVFVWNFLMWRDAKRLLSLDTSLLYIIRGYRFHAYC